MPTNNNNCRLLATSIAALVVVNALSADVFRITYTGAEGLTLNVRDRYIGGDPHNYSVYEALRMSPKDAFEHAERVFGYAPTNRNTAGVKRGIASGVWSGTQTPHWKEGDSRAAHSLISSLAALLAGGNGYAVTPARPTVRGKALEILASVGVTHPNATQVAEVECALKRWGAGNKLRNDAGYIGGIRIHFGTRYLSALTNSGAEIGDNFVTLRAVGIADPAQAKDFLAILNRGVRPTSGAFPEVPYDSLPSVRDGLLAAARSYKHGGVLLLTGYDKQAVLSIMDKIAETNGEFYDAACSLGAISVALGCQLRNLA